MTPIFFIDAKAAKRPDGLVLITLSVFAERSADMESVALLTCTKQTAIDLQAELARLLD